METREKMQITDQVCKQAQLMRKGGASQAEVGQLLGISASTVCRMERAGFDKKQYDEDRKIRRAREKKREEAAEETAEEQVPGQIRMEIPEKIQGVPINAMYADEVNREYPESVKLMRFQAAQADKIMMKLEKLNDTLSMILRAVRRD